MSTPFETALLNLRLFELRREPVLREARAWFLADFNPESFADLVAVVGGDRNASFRMVLGYWDMAASLVTAGAIDAPSFLAAHTEVFGTFSKVEPFLAELRTVSREPHFCRHLETVVMSAPDAEPTLARRRQALRNAAAARRAGAAEAAAVDTDAVGALVRRYIDAIWNRADVAALDALTRPSFVYHLGGQPARDRAAFAGFIRGMHEAFPDWRVEIHALIVEGSRASVRWSAQATHEGPFRGIPPTGRRITVSGINEYEIDGGTIAAEWEQMDSLGMLQQLGVVPG